MADTGGPLYIGAEIYSQTAFPRPHPLAIPRAGAVEAMCRALGWLDDDYVTSPVASRAELTRYHDPAYVEAVARADADIEPRPSRFIHPLLAVGSRDRLDVSGIVKGGQFLDAGGRAPHEIIAQPTQRATKPLHRTRARNRQRMRLGERRARKYLGADIERREALHPRIGSCAMAARRK